MRLLIALFCIAIPVASASTDTPPSPDRVQQLQQRLVTRFGLTLTPDMRVLHHYYLDAAQGYYMMSLVSCPKDKTEMLLKTSRFPMDALSAVVQIVGRRSAPEWGAPERLRAVVDSGRFLSGHIQSLEREERLAVLIDRRDETRDFIYFEDSGG